MADTSFDIKDIDHLFKEMNSAFVLFKNTGHREDYDLFEAKLDDLIAHLIATLMSNQTYSGANDALFAGILYHMDREMDEQLAKPMNLDFKGITLTLTINPVLFYMYYEKPESMLAGIRQMCYHVLFAHLVLYDWAFKNERDAKIMSVAMEVEVNQYIKNLPETAPTLEWLKETAENKTLAPKQGSLYYFNKIKETLDDATKPGNLRMASTFRSIKGSGQMSENYAQLTGEFKSAKNSDLRIESMKQLQNEMKQNKTMHQVIPKSQNQDLYRKLMNGLVKQSYSQLTDEMREALSSEIKESIDQMTKQRSLNWMDIIKRGLGETAVPYKESKNRMNRRQPLRVDLPGRTLDTASRLVAFFDTSASQNKDALAYSLGELANIQKTLGTEIWTIQIDTTIQSVQRLNVNNLADFEFVGRGGTSFAPAYAWLHQMGFTNDDTVAVYFTDGYGDDGFERYGFTNMYWVLTDTKPGDPSSLSTDGGGKVLYLQADERYNRQILRKKANDRGGLT